MEITKLKDLAELAGVSIKTVSRAINGHPDVSEQLRAKILRLVKETSYTPHLGARGLRLKKSYSIGFVFPQITNEFFLEVALSLDTIARQNGYSVIMSSTKETEESEADSINLLVSKRVDGIILVSVGTTGALLKSIMERHKIPVVLIGNRVAGLATDTVLEDNERGAHLLTTHLIDHGHRRFAYVTGPMNNSSSQERYKGFQRALDEKAIPIQANQIRVSDWTYSGGYAATLELTQRSRSQPTAIFFANANTAVGALRALRQRNLKVPQDIALVAFENISITDAVEPPLTTLNKVNHKLGLLSFKLLQAKMSGMASEASRPIERVINAKLCIRESCGCPGNVVPRTGEEPRAAHHPGALAGIS